MFINLKLLLIEYILVGPSSPWPLHWPSSPWPSPWSSPWRLLRLLDRALGLLLLLELRRCSRRSCQPPKPRISMKITHLLQHAYVFVSLVMCLHVFLLVLHVVWLRSCVQCGWCSVLQAHKQYAICALQAKHIGAIRGHCGSIMSQWRCHCYFYVWCMCWRSNKHGFKYARCLRAHMQSCIPCVRMPLRPSHHGTHEAGCWCTSVGFSGTGA